METSEWTEWHLTPRGWEKGSYQLDVTRRIAKPPPADRVLTLRLSESADSATKPLHTREEIWRSAENDTVKALLTKFGNPPERL